MLATNKTRLQQRENISPSFVQICNDDKIDLSNAFKNNE